MIRFRVRRMIAAPLALWLALIIAADAHAQWPANPGYGLTLSELGSGTHVTGACDDGHGGAYLTWWSPWPYGTALRHIDAFGTDLFPAGTMMFDTTMGGPRQLLADGAGGALFLTDKRSESTPGALLSLLRLDATGGKTWQTPFWQGGIAGRSYWTSALNDAATGSTFIAWIDATNTAWTIRVQRIDALGQLAWPGPGAAVADSVGNPFISSSWNPGAGVLAPDDGGGVWVTFSTGSNPRALRIQHIRADGSAQWPDTGLFVHADVQDIAALSIASDHAGGAYFSWNAAGAVGDTAQKIQRVRADGSLAFGASGLQLPGAPGKDRGFAYLAARPDGKVFVSWAAAGGVTVEHAGPVARYDGRLAVARTGTSVSDCNAEWGGAFLFANADGSLTTVAAPHPDPSLPPGAYYQGSAQRLTASGERMWKDPAPMWFVFSLNQVLYSQYGANSEAYCPVPTGDGGMMFFHSSADSGSGNGSRWYAIRAQHFDPWGRFGETTPRILALRDAPNDMGGALEMRWHASSLEGDATMAIVAYDLVREDPSPAGPTLTPVATIAAMGDTGYVALAPTLADSTTAGGPRATLRVLARDASGHTWLSPSATAASFPNSPPLAVEPNPLTFALAAPAPNPARGQAAIAFTLPVAGTVRLELLDASGRRVRTLASGPHEAGRFTLATPLEDANGRPLSAGLYFLRLAAGGATRVRRLAVLD